LRFCGKVCVFVGFSFFLISITACSLSVAHIDTISQAIEVYKFWIEGQFIPSSMLKNMQHYFQLFIESMFSTFEMTVDMDPRSSELKSDEVDSQIEKKLRICEAVVQAYKSIADQKVQVLSEQTW
jgi:hypothetical protein